jgi:hypothetical protein
MAKTKEMRHPHQSVPQMIMSAPRRMFVGKYLTPKGEKLLLSAKTKAEKNAIWEKYGKNRYQLNPESRPVKLIYHFRK